MRNLQNLEPIDYAYAALRTGALIVGVAYGYFGCVGATARTDVLLAFGAFAAYGMVAYVAGFRALSSGHNHGFYAGLGAADLVFVIYLMHLTGGEASPFYRALYLWVAMPAFRFGSRTGTLASALAFAVFVWFFTTGTWAAWDVLVKGGGLLLHGPVIGYLVERDRALQAKLHERTAP
ncbi:MAG TPA: hypothetical protein VF331_17540 [Polyangiales bacterium]